MGGWREKKAVFCVLDARELFREIRRFRHRLQDVSDEPIFQSRFGRWCAEHEPLDYERGPVLRQEALGILVESINAGEISSLDGVDTPLSMKIKAHHQLADFEMNSNWIGSSQDWVCPCCSRSKFQISRSGKKCQILTKQAAQAPRFSHGVSGRNFSGCNSYSQAIYWQCVQAIQI